MEPLRDKNGMTEAEFLASYSPADYPRPSFAADIAAFAISNPEGDCRKKPSEKELQILLIKRGGHPSLGSWALPGGFVNPDETAGQAARREFAEETGVSRAYVEQFFTFSQPGRDPRAWSVSCAHLALIDKNETVVSAGDDASDAAWFRMDHSLNEDIFNIKLSRGNEILRAIVERNTSSPESEFRIIESEGLAFDHAKVIAHALASLQERAMSADVALHLLPKLFTMSELQQVYELILGKKLLNSVFRRQIGPMLCPTEEYSFENGRRPSRLYQRAQLQGAK